MLQASLRTGINLTSLDVPTGMEHAIDAVAGATHAIFVLYCFGAAAAGLAILMGAAAVLISPMVLKLANAGLLALGFFVIGLASTISQIIVSEVTNAINEVGPDVGIEAIQGTKFIALTWAATALLGAASLVWTVEAFLARRSLAHSVVNKLEGGLARSAVSKIEGRFGSGFFGLSRRDRTNQ